MRIRTATAAAVLATAVILGSAGSAAAWGNDDNDGSGHDGNSKSRVSSHLDYDWRSIDDSILAKITNDNDSTVSSEYDHDETNVVGNVNYDDSGARTGHMFFG